MAREIFSDEEREARMWGAIITCIKAQRPRIHEEINRFQEEAERTSKMDSAKELLRKVSTQSSLFRRRVVKVSPLLTKELGEILEPNSITLPEEKLMLEANIRCGFGNHGVISFQIKPDGIEHGELTKRVLY